MYLWTLYRPLCINSLQGTSLCINTKGATMTTLRKTTVSLFGLTGATVSTRVFGTWIARRRGRRALAQLDAHLLRDIGLDAHGAATEVRKPIWKD
jgi:uncharacterized protein YjiS (DUF1127 family)